MKLKLVKATNKYRNQIVDMLDEWNNSGEEIIPYVIGRNSGNSEAQWTL